MQRFSTSPSRTPRRQHRSPSPAPNGRRSPSPPPVSRSGNKIGIERLTKNVTREHLEEIFSVYGQVVDIFLPMRNGANKGFSHITFASEEEAQRAIKHMDKGQLDGNVLEVALWVPREPRRRPSHQQPQRRPYSPPRRYQAPRPRSPPRYRPRSPYRRSPSPYRSPYNRSPAHHRRRSPLPPSPYNRHRRPSVSRTPRRDSVPRTPRRQRSISRTPRRYQQRSPSRSPSRAPRRQRSVSRTPPRRRYSRSRTPPRRPYY
jgi:RNA-binding protein with serine-rich domain 1